MKSNSKYSILSIFISLFLIVFVFFSYQGKKTKTFKLDSSIDKFKLLTHTGQKFNSQLFSKSPSLLFFGFTNCPDICPMTLDTISNLIEKLDTNANRLNYYFITVDPEKDNIETLNDYLENFNKKIIGVTGSVSDMQNFLTHMYIYSKKIYLDNDIYTVDHSSQIFIFDINGNFFGTISSGENDETIFGKINKVISVRSAAW